MSFTDLESSYEVEDTSELWQRRLTSIGQGCAAAATTTQPPPPLEPESVIEKAINSNIEDPRGAAIVIGILLFCAIIASFLKRKYC